MSNFHIAIISAMPEEVGNTLKHLEEVSHKEFGDLKIYTGKWYNKKINSQPILISLAWSGWGKVSASRAITRLISNTSLENQIDFILFTGVAGAVDLSLKQWDIVIADKVIQYDMDARPLFKKFYIPALNKDKLISSQRWKEKIYQKILEAKKEGNLREFGNLKEGLIGTADRFVSNRDNIKETLIDLDDLIAVEMEGAAVAQVAEQEGIPWVVIRVISDEANSDAAKSFSKFLEIYKINSWYLLNTILQGVSI